MVPEAAFRGTRGLALTPSSAGCRTWLVSEWLSVHGSLLSVRLRRRGDDEERACFVAYNDMKRGRVIRIRHLG